MNRLRDGEGLDPGRSQGLNTRCGQSEALVTAHCQHCLIPVPTDRLCPFPASAHASVVPSLSIKQGVLSSLTGGETAYQYQYQSQSQSQSVV